MRDIIEYNVRPKSKPRMTLFAETEKTIRSLIVTLTSMIVVLLVAFLFLTSQSAQNGYTLQQEKLKNEYLKSVSSNLTTKITESTAFSSLEEENKILEMQALEEKTYVTKEDNEVK